MRHLFLALPLPLLLDAATLPAQERPRASDEPRPIQDNSFLVEEAYNQERGVVQHISAFARTIGGDAWAYAFTQEWPLGGLRHQVSYTLLVSRADEPGGSVGLGDVALNYRYQIGNAEGSPVAFAPRLTALLPVGSSRKGLGAGGPGVQLNLPLSIALPAIALHSNAGVTYTPRARDALGDRAPTARYNFAQSLVWLVHPKLNLLLEVVGARTQDVVGPDRTSWNTELLLSPGVRGALDFRSGLQIVPGLAFPVGVGPSSGERSVLVYLSFEHPFAKQRGP
jgi:hypothetical protein